jgi:hypothetical protein
MVENQGEITVVPFGEKMGEIYQKEDRVIMIVDLVKIGDVYQDSRLTCLRDVDDVNEKRLAYANVQLHKIRNSNGKICEIRNNYVEVISTRDGSIKTVETSGTQKPVSMMGESEMSVELRKLLMRQNEIYQRLASLNKSIHIPMDTLTMIYGRQSEPLKAISRFKQLCNDTMLNEVLGKCNLDTAEEDLEPIKKYIEKIREAIKMPTKKGKKQVYNFSDKEIEFEIISYYEKINTTDKEDEYGNWVVDDDGNNIEETKPLHKGVVSLFKTWYVSYDD